MTSSPDSTASSAASTSPSPSTAGLTYTPRRLVRDGQPTIHYFVVGPAVGVEVKGAVLLVHGYAEHGGRYHHVVEALVARGYRVAALDLRGHGRSEGVRGHCDRFDDYLGDLDDLFEELNKSSEWKGTGKPVLLGHSFGGLLSFLYGLANPGRVRGTFLSSPFFGIKLAVPAVKRGAAQVLSRLVPTFALPSGLSGRDVTHDAEMVKQYDEDPLNGKGATARWYTETTKAHVRALELAPQFTGPLAIFAAGADRVVSVEATKAVFQRVGSAKKSLRVLDGQFHEIFNEVDRATFIGDAIDAIDGMFQ
jgi:alpha-beta hydrolase superfamily lysophospholipase